MAGNSGYKAAVANRISVAGDTLVSFCLRSIIGCEADMVRMFKKELLGSLGLECLPSQDAVHSRLQVVR